MPDEHPNPNWLYFWNYACQNLIFRVSSSSPTISPFSTVLVFPMKGEHAICVCFWFSNGGSTTIEDVELSHWFIQSGHLNGRIHFTIVTPWEISFIWLHLNVKKYCLTCWRMSCALDTICDLHWKIVKSRIKVSTLIILFHDITANFCWSQNSTKNVNS